MQCVIMYCDDVLMHMTRPLILQETQRWVPKRKQRKKKRVGACSLIHNTSRVGECARAQGWD
jgi:hypothetical protein